MNLMVNAYYDAFYQNIIVPSEKYTNDASQSYLQYITKELLAEVVKTLNLYSPYFAIILVVFSIFYIVSNL